MGLDMYLHAKRYVSAYSDTQLRDSILAALGMSANEVADNGIYVSLPAAYWRKANAIHGWFVANVQEGNDNCREYYVEREQLEELRDLCKSVLSGEATKDDLPPVDGFFFGLTDDDEYYKADLEDTVEQLDKVLSNKSFEGCDFYYDSSW